MCADVLLAVRDLEIGFPTDEGSRRPVLERFSLEISTGERVALVGESGSGKSVAALACLGLVHPPGERESGTIEVAGVDVFTAGADRLRRIRGGTVGMVFQEPTSALNPVYTVGYQIAETIRAHREVTWSAARADARRLLDAVSLDIERAYPHQLSGGQAQRVMIALALAGEPRLLIADEPTTALDLITQAEILELLGALTGGDRTSLLLISHDLTVVAGIADRVVVMYAGRTVEQGRTADVLEDPRHPYTRMLLEARARIGDEQRSPSARWALPADEGCRFAPRCPVAADSCRELEPELLKVGADRLCRCPVTVEASGG